MADQPNILRIVVFTPRPIYLCCSNHSIVLDVTFRALSAAGCAAAIGGSGGGGHFISSLKLVKSLSLSETLASELALGVADTDPVNLEDIQLEGITSIPTGYGEILPLDQPLLSIPEVEEARQHSKIVCFLISKMSLRSHQELSEYMSLLATVKQVCKPLSF